MKAKILRLILISLNACDGMPMPEAALASAVDMGMRPAEATRMDMLGALKDLEAEGYVAGLTDELTRERSWGLTEKGTFKARQLR